MKQKHSFLLLVLLSALRVSTTHTSESDLEPNGWLSDLPTIFRAGSGFACSIGAAAAFVTSACILMHQHKAHTIDATSTHATFKKTTYIPPREFWWSVSTGAAFLAALYILTATEWSKGS